MAVLYHWGNIKPQEHIGESGSVSMLLARFDFYFYLHNSTKIILSTSEE